MKKIYLLLIVFFGTVVNGQNFSTSMMENMKPRNIGPGGMSGRVTAIDVVNNLLLSNALFQQGKQ